MKMVGLSFNMPQQLLQIISPIQEEMEEFEFELKKIISNSENFLKEDLYNFLFSNAKRLRPILIFLFAKILNIKSSYVIKIAIITELLHNASLIHDDILDEEKIRRNMPTFFAKFNSKIAVLGGDFLLSLALCELSKLDNKIIEIFSSRILKTIKGELVQTENLDKIVSQDIYLNKTLNKTGNLFFAGLESLYELTLIDVDAKFALNSFLENFCVAFQMQNDIQDVDRNMFSDFKNGNYTLPMIYFFMENNRVDDSFAIDKNNLNKYIILAKEMKNKYFKNALKALDYFKKNIYCKNLIQLSDYVLR